MSKQKLVCSKCNERFYRLGFKFCPFDGTPIEWKTLRRDC